MKIAIIQGPNLNLLGKREPHIYGNHTLNEIHQLIAQHFSNISFTFFQSNIEGEIINELHRCAEECDAIIINPASYTHTSVAIADAIAAINKPVIEVHLSNIHSREPFRHTSLTGSKCKGIITGFGVWSYFLAIDAIRYMLKGETIDHQR